jgi:hypothetical protein
MFKWSKNTNIKRLKKIRGMRGYIKTGNRILSIEIIKFCSLMA